MGRQMLQELKDFCSLRPTDDVLEIGCSCGIVAMPLQSFLTTGRYTGLDIIPESIAWCQTHLSNERFRFADLNVYHPLYNPRGTADPDRVQLPVENGSADVVFLISVFTHMLPDTIQHYLQEISRVLKPEGRCLATMLTKDRYVPGRSMFQLRHEVSADCLCWDDTDPTVAVAVSHALITRLAENSGLTISHMTPGKWDGHTQSPYVHDMYVFTKVS